MGAIFTCSTDDGHPSDMKMAALLNKHALDGTFFIPIKNIEGMSVMSQAQIRELSQQFEIGSHTVDHRFLNTVNIAQARFQIANGKAMLEDTLGREVSGFCYPGGKYRKEHIDLVHSAGFRYARTTMNLCFDPGIGRFEIATTCQFYPHARAVYARNFVWGGRWRQRQSGLFVALAKHDWIARLYGLFDHACAENAIFHLWGHSNDIDALNAWDKLDAFLAYVGTCVLTKDRINNEQLARRFFPA